MQIAPDQCDEMEEQTRERVLRVLRRIAPEADTGTLDSQRRYRDQFEFDSVDFLNFAIGVQEEFRITIPELDFPKLATLAGCIDYLRAKARAGYSKG